ncbi:MAG TPA: hypothetical protein VJX67_07245 [Blastocatellia bacterium]|nr:hypothetical protein [Blastocatellia bacterium]
MVALTRRQKPSRSAGGGAAKNRFLLLVGTAAQPRERGGSGSLHKKAEPSRGAGGKAAGGAVLELAG